MPSPLSGPWRLRPHVRRAAALACAAVLALLRAGPASAQFLDAFDGAALEGWTFTTGDGEAVMDFQPRGGFATITVDATRDRHNVWWAFVRRDVSAALDLARLARPGYELRVEARLRTSHAPRRVNLHVNTQKTVDFHTHLMEFDIPDTLQWHTISMTTRGFDAGPGDTVNAQLALIDWGRGEYRVDLDYFVVRVVEAGAAGPDAGTAVPYHPPVADPDTLAHHVDAAQEAVVDLRHGHLNFDAWHAVGDAGPVRVLTVGGTQVVILRWDLDAFSGERAAGRGVLELTTYGVQRGSTGFEELGQVRVAEILAGDPAWRSETVTLDALAAGRPLEDVFNPQMIVDVRVADAPGGRTRITISQPVLQRMIDGRTRGLVLRPLGPIVASFTRGARLHFSTKPRW